MVDFMSEHKKLIVNADDFGFSEAVNYGILKAHKDGIVTSTTIMANMPGFEHAIMLAKKNPTLRIGVHLNLTCYKPLLKDHQTLVNAKGMFNRKNEDNYSEYEMYEELCAQIERVLGQGIVIDHFDSHHHIHTEKRYQRVIEKILRRYPYPIRGGFMYKNDYPFQSTLQRDFYDEGVSVKNLVSIIKNLKEDKVYDLMCHPAYIDSILLENSSYILKRCEEAEILCSKEIQEVLEENQVDLVTYNCL